MRDCRRIHRRARPTARSVSDGLRGVNGRLSGSSGVALQGGGLLVTNPLFLTNSSVTGNVPDNCLLRLELLRVTPTG
jgi:hypothetical protein